MTTRLEQQKESKIRVTMIRSKRKSKELSNETENNTKEEFIVYSSRWWLLSTVIILNLANYSHWVAFPSVAKSAAEYYDVSGEKMDLIPTISYGLGVPVCILATYIVERFGVKVGLHIGGILTGIGGLLCFLSSFSILSNGLSSESKFILALVGQSLTGIACPFISCIPTKISQHWFGDSQRNLATILLGMSNPMGIVLGQGITPLLVKGPQDIPLMNLVWFIPACIGSFLTMWKITSNRPPSPPSKSAAAQVLNSSGNYMKSLKSLTLNGPFILLFLFLGAAMGYISTISTKIEQILCSVGYSDQLSGLGGSLILLSGFLASFLFGFLAYKLKRTLLLCKLSSCIVIGFLLLIAYVFRQPHSEIPILLSCVLLGIFSLGAYPLALELVVECTYPLDQATPTAFIFLSSSLQGVFLMEIENTLGSPLSEEEYRIQTCVSLTDSGHQQPKNYFSYLNFITAYIIFFICLFIVFFKTKMNRSLADEKDFTDKSKEGQTQETLLTQL